MNLIIATATEFVKDVLDQVRLILEQSDHSMRRSVDNSLVERENAIIDGSLESTGSLMTFQYHPSESVILDDNRDDGDADDIQHLSISAAVQFDSAMELAVASTRNGSDSVDQVNGTDVNLHEKRHLIELTPMIPLRVGVQVPEESPTSSDNEEKTWGLIRVWAESCVVAVAAVNVNGADLRTYRCNENLKV
ncbi:hypothetical protein QTP88_012020 [Uroleucon formosanum]